VIIVIIQNVNYKINKMENNSVDNIVRVLGDFVLVEQTMTKKHSLIITDAAKDKKDTFDYAFKVVQKGKECKRDINVGESPIFSEYVKFSGLKILEKTDTRMVSLVIVHENDIIGVDLEPVEPNKNLNLN